MIFLEKAMGVATEKEAVAHNDDCIEYRICISECPAEAIKSERM
jgi:NAD-dependent dihydropyrimidine dehydrogenase PreA subunit